jgi:aspartate ammonia-lyase
VVGHDRLLGSMATLRGGFEAKAEEFKDILKIGRTQLQDAVPMTLGQEFSTYAVMIEEDEARLREARALIQEINLGATAIGTGINAPPAMPTWPANTWPRKAAFRWSRPTT